MKNFLFKCDQIRRKLRIWSHVLFSTLMENFISCAMARPSGNGPRMEKGLTNFCLSAIYPDLIVFVMVKNLNCRKTSVN